MIDPRQPHTAWSDRRWLDGAPVLTGLAHHAAGPCLHPLCRPPPQPGQHPHNRNTPPVSDR